MWAVLSPIPIKREGDGSLFCFFFLRLSMISWGPFYVMESVCDFLKRHNLLIKFNLDLRSFGHTLSLFVSRSDFPIVKSYYFPISSRNKFNLVIVSATLKQKIFHIRSTNSAVFCALQWMSDKQPLPFYETQIIIPFLNLRSLANREILLLLNGPLV